MIHSSFSFPKTSGSICQDALFVEAGAGRTVASVADGMGGRPFGEVAAKIAIQAVSDRYRSNKKIDESLFSEITDAIAAEDSRRGNQGMGTTLLALDIYQNAAQLFSAGDCLALHLRGNGIKRLNTPQTEAEHLVGQGLISRAAARRYPRRNILMSALTSKGQYAIEAKSFFVQTGDTIIVMSDGVYDILTLQEIHATVSREPNIDAASRALSASVESIGPTDDYSAVLLRV